MKTFGHELHQTMVAKIESAQRPLRVRELVDFAALYGVNIQDLIYPPPDGSLAEIEEEIAELSQRRDLAERDMHCARQVQVDLMSQVAKATDDYDHASADLAVVAARLDSLINERDQLVAWNTNDKNSG